MADELTPRLGLPIYTSGASQHPTREDFNARMELLEEAVAIAQQGTAEDRPLPSTRGTLFMETDTGLLWFDTGDEWIRVVRIGNDGPGRALNIDGPGSEGTSRWAARADHTHPLPLATGTESGAMGADDKALLDTASANATSNSLARRNGSGQISVAGPSAAGHATHRGYVDGQVNSLTSRVDGLSQHRQRIHAGDMDDVTTAGVYSVLTANISDVSNLPATLTYSSLIDVATGPNGFIVQYVHEVFSPARMYYRVRTATDWRPWTRVIDSENDGHLLDMVDSATANSSGFGGLMIRNSEGQSGVREPTLANHIANKSYVDGEIRSLDERTRVRYLNTENLNDVTEPGFYIQESNANATLARSYPPGVANGGELRVWSLTGTWLMQVYNDLYGGNATRYYSPSNGWSDWDNATQDIRDATWNGGPGTLVRRSSPNERIQIGDPSAASDATTKRYVDDQIDGITQSRNRITSGDLDDYTTAGVYSVWAADFDQVSNVPGATSSILLEVTPGPNNFIRQDATNVFSNNRWWRTRTATVWRDWSQVATV